MKKKSFFDYGVCLLLACVVSACSALRPQHPPVPESKAQVPEAPKVREPVVALVLGGGGVKGFAHVGVIKVLESHDIKPQIVVGTSAGSFVGAMYASGMSAFELQRVAMGIQESDIRDLTLSSKGFLVGDKLQQFVNAQVKNRPIQALPIRFAAVATDLQSGSKVVFQSGNTGQAVRASCSIPNVFLPVQIGVRQFADGGLVSPVPVLTARDLGADVVIAVDISARPKKAVGDMGWWGLFDQTINIMGQQSIKTELTKADVVIQPSVQHADTLSLDQRHEFFLEGERVAQKEVGSIKAAIAAAQLRLIAEGAAKVQAAAPAAK